MGVTPQSLAAYDAATNRTELAARCKALRAQGTKVTEIRELLDANGVPHRMQLIAGGAIVWEYRRDDWRPPERHDSRAVPMGSAMVTVMPEFDDDVPVVGRRGR